MIATVAINMKELVQPYKRLTEICHDEKRMTYSILNSLYCVCETRGSLIASQQILILFVRVAFVCCKFFSLKLFCSLSP